MAETHREEQGPRQRLLSAVDNVIDTNPKSNALMPDGSNFTFSVGAIAASGQEGAPRQLIIANRPAFAGMDRTTTIAVRAAGPADFRLAHIEPSKAVDILTAQPLGDEQLIDLTTMLGEADFSDGSLVQEFQSRMTTPGRYARWIEALIDTEPIISL